MTHPITPPPELVRQWSIEAENEHQPTVAYSMVSLLAAKAVRWGADQELEACLVEASFLASRSLADRIRAARRPKPPSLKEQALETLQRLSEDKYPCNYQEDSDWNTIRRALNELPDN